MAKTTVSELQVLISANAASFQAQLDAVKKQMASMGAASNSMGSKLGAGLKGTIVKYAGLGAAITGAYKAMRTASSYIEDENLFAVSMNTAADSTRAWSDQVERSVGVSGAWLRKYTGVMTNMTQSMGLSHDTAAKLGKNVALLSQDIASFYNISPEAAFEKMQSAMAGMPRPLQELGIMVRDQELEQTALAMGIRKTNGEFTSAQKALLTYETVIRSTKNAQGDLARTLNTPANQMRMLATNARNLGVAIGTMFQPLLSVALPALNAIVMAATSAIRALAGLFGIEFKADAGGVGEVASGVGGIGEAADKAGGKVKKLKGQLASFDEMNTLQEQDSGGGSGGGGGAGSLPQIDWSKYNAGLDNVKNKAVAMAEAIKKAFKDFGKGFDFAKIGNAFKRFFNDANKFLKPIGKILGDLWGYFKPFIYWTANDLLPAFLNALGGAINFVGVVIGRVWDSFLKPFVDAFLVPIASFTGGVIVWVLNAIGDGLRWIAENKLAMEIIESVAIGVTAMTVAYNAYLFIAGIAKGVQLAMNGVMIAGTVASSAYAAGIGVVTTAQKIATVATAMFGVALKTLPFVAVIAGITLLISSIVLCIKHWDDICKFVKVATDNIKKFVGNMVYEVGTFFKHLWDGICNVFKDTGNWFKNKFTDAWNAIVNVFSGASGWFGNIFNRAWNGVANAFSGANGWARDRFNDIKNAFGNAFNVFSDIGRNIWNGLKNGIGNIANNMKNMFAGAVDGVKRFLGIHSPSRVFMGIGGYMGEGLAIGLDNEKTNVLSSLKSLTDLNPPKIDSDLLITPSLNGSQIHSETNNLSQSKTISLLLKIDGKDIPVNIEQIAEALNDQAFMRNSAIIDLY